MNKVSFFSIFSIVGLIAALLIGAQALARVLKHKHNRLSHAPSFKDKLSVISEGAGIYFLNRYQPSWQKGEQETHAEKKEQISLFKYRLQIEHIIDTADHIQVNHKRPTVYFHG